MYVYTPCTYTHVYIYIYIYIYITALIVMYIQLASWYIRVARWLYVI